VKICVKLDLLVNIKGLNMISIEYTCDWVAGVLLSNWVGGFEIAIALATSSGNGCKSAVMGFFTEQLDF